MRSDQMLHYAASDLGLHCLLRPLCPFYRLLMSKTFWMSGIVDPNQMLNLRRLIWVYFICAGLSVKYIRCIR